MQAGTPERFTDSGLADTALVARQFLEYPTLLQFLPGSSSFFRVAMGAFGSGVEVEQVLRAGQASSGSIGLCWELVE